MRSACCALAARPPYYEQGRQLYYDYYKPEDHADLALFIGDNMKGCHWIVSYDNVAPIKELYAGFRSIIYDVGYSARETRTGKKAMFFSSQLAIPQLVGLIRQVGKIKDAA